DITEQKKIELELRHSEARFRAIYERAGIGIAIADMHGHILEANPALQHMLGYSAAEFQKLTLDEISKEEEMIEERRNISRILLSNPKASYSTEKQYRRKNGTMLWGHLTITVMRDDHGAPRYGLGIIEDMSERKAAEEERERLITNLQEALADVRTLGGLLPICSSCKRIRDDKGYWNLLEKYLTENAGVTLSHGICPDCERKLYPHLYDDSGERKKRQKHTSAGGSA
ncbi:MAG: PAS domain S-box protein, partial [Ignavibacteriales bacterium]|nr:PAS domain S-box protein [Ignavibacteriales bacterium]